jgi:hypothetical protein
MAPMTLPSKVMAHPLQRVRHPARTAATRPDATWSSEYLGSADESIAAVLALPIPTSTLATCVAVELLQDQQMSASVIRRR